MKDIVCNNSVTHNFPSSTFRKDGLMAKTPPSTVLPALNDLLDDLTLNPVQSVTWLALDVAVYRNTSKHQSLERECRPLEVGSVGNVGKLSLQQGCWLYLQPISASSAERN